MPVVVEVVEQAGDSVEFDEVVGLGTGEAETRGLYDAVGTGAGFDGKAVADERGGCGPLLQKLPSLGTIMDGFGGVFGNWVGHKLLFRYSSGFIRELAKNQQHSS